MNKQELLEVARKGTVVLMVGTLAGKDVETELKHVVDAVAEALFSLKLLGVDISKDVLDVAEDRANQLVAAMVADQAIRKAAQA